MRGAFATDSWREQHGHAEGERGPDAEVVKEVFEGIGACIMGRKMFGGGGGPWDETWTGWWGQPPYHCPVHVLTHHPREPLQMQGATTFHFVTEGIESALSQARAAVGDTDVSLAGGASTCGSSPRPDCSTSCTCTSSRSSSAGERLLEDVGPTPSWNR